MLDIYIVDMTDDEFTTEFDLDFDHTIYAFCVNAVETEFPGDFVIFMNEEHCDRDNVYVQVLAHEFGHVIHQSLKLEDTEDFADDFAFDICDELGIDTTVFKDWAISNVESYK